MLDTLRAGVDDVRARPRLALAGLAIGLGEIGGVVLFGLVAARTPVPVGAAAVLLSRIAVLAVTAAVVPGLYGRLPGTQPGASRAGLVTAGTAWWRVFAAGLAAHAVAAVAMGPLALAGASGFLGVETLLQVARGTAGDAGWRWPLLGVVVAVTLAAYASRLSLVFYDVVALAGDREPRGCWRASFRAAISRPRTLLAYGATRAALLALPLAVTVAVMIATGPVLADLATVLVMAVVFLGTTALARPLLAAVHCRVADDLAVTGAPATTPVPLPRRRTVVAGLVVLTAATGGVTAVRLADVPGPATPAAVEPGSGDPTAVLDAARTRTAAASRIERTTRWDFDDRTDSWEPFHSATTRVDTDRRRTLRRTRPADDGLPATRLYVEDGRSILPLGSDRGPRTPFDRLRYDGALRLGPPIGVIAGTVDRYPSASHPWTVANRTADLVVYELRGTERLAAAGYGVPQRDVTPVGPQYLRVAVDPRAGRIRWVRSRWAVERADGDVVGTRTERRVRYGPQRVARPAELGPSPYARFWDLIAY